MTRRLGPIFAAVALAALAASSAGATNFRTTTVMTINIYQGTELEHVLAAQTPLQLVLGVATDYSNVVATDFPLRAQALAAEIAAQQPSLVGLQEVATWSVNGVVAYDFLQLLVDALAARGQHYAPVITRENFHAEAPGLFPTGFATVALSEQTAILARTDLPTDELKLSDPQSHAFTVRTVFPFLGSPFDIGGGWLSVDAKVRGKSFRFVTTHMDPISQAARDAQAAQIVAEAESDGLPLVLVGDTNSQPGTSAYDAFVGSGLTDTWAALHPGQAGLTCCHVPPDSIDAPSPLYERVDYVLTGPGITPLDESLYNVDLSEMVGGLWPTDHAAIAATLGLDPLPQG